MSQGVNPTYSKKKQLILGIIGYGNVKGNKFKNLTNQ
mgnify:CR=1 FL=1